MVAVMQPPPGYLEDINKENSLDGHHETTVDPSEKTGPKTARIWARSPTLLLDNHVYHTPMPTGIDPATTGINPTNTANKQEPTYGHAPSPTGIDPATTGINTTNTANKQEPAYGHAPSPTGIDPATNGINIPLQERLRQTIQSLHNFTQMHAPVTHHSKRESYWIATTRTRRMTDFFQRR
jgi:hypothetical protein